MILGLNIAVFVSLVWVGCMVIVVAIDAGQGMYQEKKTTWREDRPKKADPEITVKIRGGSFDPDATMKLRQINRHEEKPCRGRHARVRFRG